MIDVHFAIAASILIHIGFIINIAIVYRFGIFYANTFSVGRQIRSIDLSKFPIAISSSTIFTNMSFPFLLGSNKFTHLLFGYLCLSLSNVSSNTNDGGYFIRLIGNRICHRHKFIFMMIVNLYHVDRNRWTSSWTTWSHQIDIFVDICYIGYVRHPIIYIMGYQYMFQNFIICFVVVHQFQNWLISK